MSIFDVYDQEFGALSKELSKNIGELRSYSDEDDRSSGLMREVEAGLAQAKDLFKQMEVEARSQDAATRKMLQERIAQCKRTEASLQADYARAKEQLQKSALIGGKSESQRQRLLSTNEKANRGNEAILGSIRTVRETEDVGIEIMTELERNREKIQSSRGKVGDFVGMTDTARRMITSMENRETQQKMVLGGLALFLVVCIILVAYFASQGSSKKN